jgi:acetyl esterase/lipase
MGTPPPHEANADPYNQAIMASPQWWAGLPVQEVLVVAGRDEILVDDIVAFAEKLREGMGKGEDGKEKVTLFVAEDECHDQTNLDVQFGYKEPGQQTKLIRSWVASKL